MFESKCFSLVETKRARKLEERQTQRKKNEKCENELENRLRLEDVENRKQLQETITINQQLMRQIEELQTELKTFKQNGNFRLKKIILIHYYRYFQLNSQYNLQCNYVIL